MRLCKRFELGFLEVARGILFWMGKIENHIPTALFIDGVAIIKDLF